MGGALLRRDLSHQRDDAAGERFIDNATTAGDRFVLWEVNGTPVSMAMLRAPAAGVSRIGPVFTPRSSRGRADLANPTSNAIYRRIGFEPVVDQVRIDVAVDG